MHCTQPTWRPESALFAVVLVLPLGCSTSSEAGVTLDAGGGGGGAIAASNAGGSNAGATGAGHSGGSSNGGHGGVTPGSVGSAGRGGASAGSSGSGGGGIGSGGADAGPGVHSGTASGRPRVFMALHGSNHLANDNTADSEWPYVREHLDGIWGNNANVSAAEEASLFYKIKTRTLITEWPMPSGTEAWVPVGVFSGAQAAHPDLMMNREAIALYTGNAADWNGRTVASANANFVTNASAPAWQLYKSVFTGWQPQNFEQPLTGDAAQAFKDAKGTFIECPGAGCAGGSLGQDMINVINAIHAQGDPFVWFASPSGTLSSWPAEFKQTYQVIAGKGLWQPHDVVMIINYGGKFQDVPETINGQDAPTVTGMLYWALHQ